MPQHNTTEIDLTAAPRGYAAARSHAGLVDRRERGRIVVSGADRASYLQGLLTNDIVALKAGQGSYSAYLTAQGRMITDLWVYELGDVMLLSLPLTTKETVLAKLDQFIFGEDVQLGDVSATFAGVAVVGPAAATVLGSVLSGVSSGALSSLGEGGNLRAAFGDEAAIVLRVDDAGVPGFEVLVGTQHYDALCRTLQANGAVDVAPDAAEALRIEGGVPVFHGDMDEETIPLEAGIEGKAISLTKGCYVGQEVIIRVLHRGHGRVVRRLVGLTLEGTEIPATGAPITSGERSIGEVTSAVWSPARQAPIALGYVQRDFVATGTAVEVAGRAAVVTALPFVASAA